MELPKSKHKKYLKQFAEDLIKIDNTLNFSISSRGWGYLLENKRLINKDQIDKVEDYVVAARKNGFLPLDFTPEDVSRKVLHNHFHPDYSIQDLTAHRLKQVKKMYDNYHPEWHKYQNYYVQILVEKVDLLGVFSSVADKYHTPLINGKGQPDINTRAQIGVRFKDAEKKGLIPILLYFGDLDPAGLVIVNGLHDNIDDLKDSHFRDGSGGYDPKNLIIDHFGLHKDQVDEYGFVWIDNLITSTKKKINDLADPRHNDHKKFYVQNYIKRYGVHKCEANALVTNIPLGEKLVTDALNKYLILENFKPVYEEQKADYNDWMEKSGVGSSLQETINLI